VILDFWRGTSITAMKVYSGVHKKSHENADSQRGQRQESHVSPAFIGNGVWEKLFPDKIKQHQAFRRAFFDFSLARRLTVGWPRHPFVKTGPYSK